MSGQANGPAHLPRPAGPAPCMALPSYRRTSKARWADGLTVMCNNRKSARSRQHDYYRPMAENNRQKLFELITMLRLSRYATAKSAVVYGLQGRRVSAFACSAGPPWGDGGPTPPRRLAPSGSAIAKSEASVVPSGGSVQIHQVGHPRIVSARQVDGHNVPIGQRRAGRLLTASLLLPGQARQGSW
jgi:hypothetical protein